MANAYEESILRHVLITSAWLPFVFALGASAWASAAPDRAITARDLAAITDAAALSISPDGHWAAFEIRKPDLGTDTYKQDWVIVGTRGGTPESVAGGGEPFQLPVNGFILSHAPVWSPDSEWFAYLRKEEGHTQIWRARRDGTPAEQLTHNAGDADAIVFAPDGKRMLFQVEPSLAQIDAALAPEGVGGFRYDRRFASSYSPDPLPLASIGFGSDRQLAVCGPDASHQIWTYDLVERRERAASQAECAEFSALAANPAPKDRPAFRENTAGASSGAFAWTEARDPDRQGGAAPLTIVARPTALAEPIVCGAQQCTGQTIKGLWWRENGELVFARGEGVRFQDTALYAWRPGDPATRLILRTRGQLISSVGEWTCAIAQDRLVCFYEEPARPRRLVAVDLNSGVIDTLYDPNPSFARFDLGPAPERLEFRSPSGVENFGYLVLPPGRRSGQRLPLVIVTYRCAGFLRGGVGDEYPIFPLAAQGVAVLCFNVPDPDYERLARMGNAEYENWDRGPGDPGKVRIEEGLETAIAKLDRMGVIDPDRVGLTGLSYGGEAVMYALFHMKRLAAAIASGTEFGPADWFLYGAAGHELLGRWGLDGWNNPRWDTLSITRNADRVRAPLLLNVADHELVDALHPYTALEQAGRAIDMYVFPDEHHIKFHPAHRLAIYLRNIDWMNFWLRRSEDPDPVKTPQYEIWHGLRDAQCKRFIGSDAPWYCAN